MCAQNTWRSYGARWLFLCMAINMLLLRSKSIKAVLLSGATHQTGKQFRHKNVNMNGPRFVEKECCKFQRSRVD